jgi:porphobilinogen synthase
MNYPYRPRRLRQSKIIRNLTAETFPDKSKLIMPHFVTEGSGKRESIKSMPGIDRVCLDDLIRDLEDDLKLGINKVILFGIPAEKDESAKGAYDKNGIIQQAVRRIKKDIPEVCVITDICLCEYTSHGHCGLVDPAGKILNDATLELLAKTAVSHAEAGADIVAPSDMMDGRIGVIRDSLDKNNFPDIPILAYSAKYASAFYGPFRDAAGSTPQFGDRKTYQMDCRNALEAEKEVLLDIDEGADIVMVKPALPYLDIIRRVKEVVMVPVCAYNVSGEFSIVKLAAKKGLCDEKAMVFEILTSIFRAGADMIISYHTRDVYKKKWF